ncbi:3-phosphoshikimate 1-carboxyvinyltransferase [Candidatus Ruminimicrobiellum ovillum]|uniref:3-phosphoshikimate 1-carboxyvinyltransferase n=1 Tax=Candidatus Ruminimicrobiellum ovillum TaxID=1947927 RepID=UPI0035598726
MKVNKVSKINGIITVPADKSITHRAIMLSSLATGKSYINNYLKSDDCLMTMNAFKQMGVNIEQTEDSLTIIGAGINGLKNPVKEIYAGNSGTTTRLLSGVLAGQKFSSTITGDASLSKRPMKRVIEPLSLMGANITAKENNFLPMTILPKENLKAISYTSPVASAQVKSCILFAGLYADGTTTVTEPIKSRDHSERMFKTFGADISVDGLSVSVKKCNELYAQEVTVPCDISSAAFFIVAGLIVPNSNIKILNVNINKTRDGILTVLKSMGADIVLDNVRTVSGEDVADIEIKTSRLNSTSFGKEIVPSLIDEIPIIVLAATQAEGQTVISGAKELKVKESDRIHSVASQLNKMGADIKETDDGFIINGPTKLKGATVDSFDDHRIAMMLSIAGLIAEGETEILNSDCVKISFANFYEVLKKICK